MSSAIDTRHPTVRSADGTQIWAASAGRSASEAPVIVFVPGFSSSSLTFRKQFQDEDLLSRYCLVCYATLVSSPFFPFLFPYSICPTNLRLLARKLTSKLSHLSQITYEPRGQGRSGQPVEKDAYSSKRNAEDFQAVCEKFGAKKVVLAGWYVCVALQCTRGTSSGEPTGCGPLKRHMVTRG